ncbi:hypothetical protein [Brumicola nitratireducens]|uniref:Uncharacterized protein n=1 Tax=Glaciecola nitratireducens (strain JCM 12485 / KCTC 12276 / FR1064) TaxID=1085623 RepID=G4QH77_GLANF|nr:hypothetical protein [Glaciecola nitratireducens]AEP29708.1 hypothetical protein GNIT_1591 [Glaciecola nitratireducens FR1064]
MHFLIINLHQLVALPLSMAGMLNTEVVHQLRADSESIFSEAIRISKKKHEVREKPQTYGLDHQEVSLTLTGGDMIKAVANIYDDLKLSQIKLWGG